MKHTLRLKATIGLVSLLLILGLGGLAGAQSAFDKLSSQDNLIAFGNQEEEEEVDWNI